MATTIERFTIDIPQLILDDLVKRLQQARWPDEAKKDTWEYGTNPAYLKELVDYWQHKYDWRVQETALNAFPQFLTTINDVSIHFIYVKGKGKTNRPLILTHGWPDSFYRYYKLIPVLTDPASFSDGSHQAFDVIIPSIPGFGFSQPIALPADKTADLLVELMTDKLGYESFFAASGDIGGTITKSMARRHPGRVKAIHLTDTGYPAGNEDWSKMSAAEQKFGKFIQQWMFTEGGYITLQSNKPQNLGYGLNDSPIGLASWIIERFYAWSDNKGDLENSFSKDELLTNIMIYWVTQTINPSMRTYFENAKASWGITGLKTPSRVETPAGVAAFPKDAPLPEQWANRMVNVVKFTEMPRGGHFAAMEEPGLLCADMYAFFKDFDYPAA